MKDVSPVLTEEWRKKGEGENWQIPDRGSAQSRESKDCPAGS
jgi:hypothetical protein